MYLLNLYFLWREKTQTDIGHEGINATILLLKM